MRFVPSAGADTDEEVAVPMGNPDPAREPSMEEILASIRQIISDDSEDETLAAEEEAGPAEIEESDMVQGDTESAARAGDEADYGDTADGTASDETEMDAESGSGFDDTGDTAGEEADDRGSNDEDVADIASDEAFDEAATGAEELAGALGEDFDDSGAGDEEAGHEETGEPLTVEFAAAGAHAAEPDRPYQAEHATRVDESDAGVQADAASGYHMAQAAAVQPAQETPQVSSTAHFHTTDVGGDARDDRLLSPDKGEAVSGAFNALTHTILAQNARTLDDLVREMLEPMLKEWLDDNLPSLVERMVREEIDRVSRGRR